jgi:hypothetical protein
VSASAYPPDWPEISLQVKQDAGWRCVRCGHRAELAGQRVACDAACDLKRHPESWGMSFADYANFTLLFPGGLLPNQRQRVLTVHHLDGDKANCRWWNLAALCQVCHLSIQGRVEMGRRWMFEHSEWFKPYVAGSYAFRYLGQGLTRPEVEARLVELLALERVV